MIELKWYDYLFFFGLIALVALTGIMTVGRMLGREFTEVEGIVVSLLLIVYFFVMIAYLRLRWLPAAYPAIYRKRDDHEF